MDTHSTPSLQTQLKTKRWYKIGEMVLLFLIPLVLINTFKPYVEADLMMTQLLVWVTNILMLIFVWAGIKLRGESWQSFGLTFKLPSKKEALKIFLQSLLVFVLAIAGFVLGSIIMANITGIPQSADMSGYEYLKNNLGLFLLALLGIYIVSSFGEEVIYRGFLINRLEQLGLSGSKGTTIAVIISAIIFGLIHYEWGAMGVVQTAFMGLALGFCYVKMQRKLWIMIIAHAYMDTILIAQMYMG